jgi:hypothetical protein
LARQTSTQLSTPQNSSSSSQRANDRERLVNIVNSGYQFVIPITVSIYDYGQKKRPTKKLPDVTIEADSVEDVKEFV